MINVCQNIDMLIDRWCQRRALKPLSILLPKYVTPLAHTDQKFELLEALRDVKGLCRKELTAEEIELLIPALNALEDSLDKWRSPQVKVDRGLS
jgi:hypothetical protein